MSTKKRVSRYIKDKQEVDFFINLKEEDITNVLDNINIYDQRIIYAYEPLYNIASNDLDYQDIENNIDKIWRINY